MKQKVFIQIINVRQTSKPAHEHKKLLTYIIFLLYL